MFVDTIDAMARMYADIIGVGVTSKDPHAVELFETWKSADALLLTTKTNTYKGHKNNTMNIIVRRATMGFAILCFSLITTLAQQPTRESVEQRRRSFTCRNDFVATAEEIVVILALSLKR